MQRSNDDMLWVVRTLLRWKWPIAGLTALAGAVAVVVTVFVMDETYQSFAIVYPTNQMMADRSTIFAAEGSNDPDAYYYGNKHDVNRILSIAHASWLHNEVIERFDLASHYGYDETTRYLATKTSEEFNDKYEAYKTDKEAVRINMLDTDPELAAEMVNYMVGRIEEEITRPIEANKRELARLFTRRLSEREAEVDSTRRVLEDMKPPSTAYELQAATYRKMVEDLNELRVLTEQYQLAADKDVPGLEIVERAFPAERKIKPVRSRICVATVAVAFVLACLLALVVEQARDVVQRLEDDEG